MINKIYKQLSEQYPNIQEWWPGNKFEICIGAVLTQNTNWKNVEKALTNMKNAKLDNFNKINKISAKELEKIIKPAGFYKQKTLYLKNLAELVLSFGNFNNFLKNVTRKQLLNVKGIGRETADSILLYACDKLHFVIDAYTRRLLVHKGIITGKEKYDEIKAMFEKQLPTDVLTYKRMHGMIVENEKNKNAPIV